MTAVFLRHFAICVRGTTDLSQTPRGFLKKSDRCCFSWFFVYRFLPERNISMGDMMKIDELIEHLKSTDGRTRDRAALTLKDAGDPRAVQPLITAICVPENENNRGTLVYALGAFDCSDHIDLLVNLVLNGNYEVSSCAFSIIDETAIPTKKRTSVGHYLNSIDISKLRHEHSSEALSALQELIREDKG